MNELGDFTCQIFTRADVTQHLVGDFGLSNGLFKTIGLLSARREELGIFPSTGVSDLLTELLATEYADDEEHADLAARFLEEEPLDKLQVGGHGSEQAIQGVPARLKLDHKRFLGIVSQSLHRLSAPSLLPALMQHVGLRESIARLYLDAHFEHDYSAFHEFCELAPRCWNPYVRLFKEHALIQPSMDLLYLLDHPSVSKQLICDEHLRKDFWTHFLKFLVCSQGMNTQVRRGEYEKHVEYVDSESWSMALTLHTDLIATLHLQTYSSIVETLLFSGQERAWLRESKNGSRPASVGLPPRSGPTVGPLLGGSPLEKMPPVHHVGSSAAVGSSVAPSGGRKPADIATSVGEGATTSIGAGGAPGLLRTSSSAPAEGDVAPAGGSQEHFTDGELATFFEGLADMCRMTWEALDWWTIAQLDAELSLKPHFLEHVNTCFLQLCAETGHNALATERAADFAGLMMLQSWSPEGDLVQPLLNRRGEISNCGTLENLAKSFEEKEDEQISGWRGPRKIAPLAFQRFWDAQGSAAGTSEFQAVRGGGRGTEYQGGVAAGAAHEILLPTEGPPPSATKTVEGSFGEKRGVAAGAAHEIPLPTEGLPASATQTVEGSFLERASRLASRRLKFDAEVRSKARLWHPMRKLWLGGDYSEEEVNKKIGGPPRRKNRASKVVLNNKDSAGSESSDEDKNSENDSSSSEVWSTAAIWNGNSPRQDTSGRSPRHRLMERKFILHHVEDPCGTIARNSNVGAASSAVLPSSPPLQEGAGTHVDAPPPDVPQLVAPSERFPQQPTPTPEEKCLHGIKEQSEQTPPAPAKRDRASLARANNKSPHPAWTTSQKNPPDISSQFYFPAGDPATVPLVADEASLFHPQESRRRLRDVFELRKQNDVLALGKEILYYLKLFCKVAWRDYGGRGDGTSRPPNPDAPENLYEAEEYLHHILWSRETLSLVAGRLRAGLAEFRKKFRELRGVLEKMVGGRWWHCLAAILLQKPALQAERELERATSLEFLRSCQGVESSGSEAPRATKKHRGTDGLPSPREESPRGGIKKSGSAHFGEGAELVEVLPSYASSFYLRMNFDPFICLTGVHRGRANEKNPAGVQHDRPLPSSPFGVVFPADNLACRLRSGLEAIVNGSFLPAWTTHVVVEQFRNTITEAYTKKQAAAQAQEQEGLRVGSLGSSAGNNGEDLPPSLVETVAELEEVVRGAEGLNKASKDSGALMTYGVGSYKVFEKWPDVELTPGAENSLDDILRSARWCAENDPTIPLDEPEWVFSPRVDRPASAPLYEDPEPDEFSNQIDRQKHLRTMFAKESLVAWTSISGGVSVAEGEALALLTAKCAGVCDGDNGDTSTILPEVGGVVDTSWLVPLVSVHSKDGVEADARCVRDWERLFTNETELFVPPRGPAIGQESSPKIKPHDDVEMLDEAGRQKDTGASTSAGHVLHQKKDHHHDKKPAAASTRSPPREDEAPRSVVLAPLQLESARTKETCLGDVVVATRRGPAGALKPRDLDRRRQESVDYFFGSGRGRAVAKLREKARADENAKLLIDGMVGKRKKRRMAGYLEGVKFDEKGM